MWAAGLAVAGVPKNPNPARLIVLSYGGVDPCDSNSANAAVRDTARLYEAALAEVPPAAAAPEPAAAAGGGALSPAWLLGLALAVAGLGRTAWPASRR